MSYLYVFFVLVLWLFFIVFTSIYMILRILTLLYFVPVASYTWFRPLISVGWYIFTVYFFLFSASGFSFSLFTLLFFSFYFFRSAFFFSSFIFRTFGSLWSSAEYILNPLFYTGCQPFNLWGNWNSVKTVPHSLVFHRYILICITLLRQLHPQFVLFLLLIRFPGSVLFYLFLTFTRL